MLLLQARKIEAGIRRFEASGVFEPPSLASGEDKILCPAQRSELGFRTCFVVHLYTVFDACLE